MTGVYRTLDQVAYETKCGPKNDEDNQSAEEFVLVGRGCQSVF